ncbi:MAG: tetratricopeptide repeat protein, partial [Rhodothermales bacterium]|nr:tetratricopeptide repeat protein [Rhodothermales bacterium]
DMDRAVAAAEKAAAIDDDIAQVRYALGRVYYRKTDYESAELEFLRAIDRDENLVDAYHELGHAYYRQGEMALAEEKYKEAIRREPNNWVFHNSLGMLYDNTGRHLDAIAPFTTVTTIAPNVHYGYYNLGITYYELADLDRALEWFNKSRQASDTQSSEADYFESVADVKSALDDFSTSAENWRKVVAITPKVFHPWMQLGDALYFANDERGAREAWAIADSLARAYVDVGGPDDNKALAAVAKIAAVTNNRPAVTDHLDQLLGLQHLGSEDHVRITTIFETIGNRNSALSYARQAFASGASLFNFEVVPWLDGLRATTEFQALAQEFE